MHAEEIVMCDSHLEPGMTKISRACFGGVSSARHVPSEESGSTVKNVTVRIIRQNFTATENEFLRGRMAILVL